MIDVFDTDPDFINEQGVKWWLHKRLTKHAQDKNIHGWSLPNYHVFLVLTPNGEKSCVILDDDIIVYENTDLCAVYDVIDMHKLARFRK